MDHGKYSDDNLANVRAPAYALLYMWATEIAHENGYAIGLHGTMQRDLDLIACPWTDKAIGARELIDLIAARCGGYVDERMSPDKNEKRDNKPHGRKAWVIQLGAGAYMDISVMPRKD